MLNQLPVPPPDKSGWPWTEESESLPPLQPDNNPWPRISIVTPSYNQGQFIEETIRSIILQNYPNLEYIIIDGGSTDNTLEIIRKYETWITYWTSEPDNGQSQAINKGFKKCTGNMVNWICSDDMLCQNALTKIAPLLDTEKKVLLWGNGYRIDKNSKLIDKIKTSQINNFSQLADIGNYWRRGNSILQQSAFFSVVSVKEAGYLNENNYYTMDYELWGRLMLNGISLVRTEVPIGMFRWYSGQKTSNQKHVTESLTITAQHLVLSNLQTSNASKLVQLIKIRRYRLYYKYTQFRSFIGIKRRFRTLFHG